MYQMSMQARMQSLDFSMKFNVGNTIPVEQLLSDARAIEAYLKGSQLVKTL